jgi:hypothetical protein
MHDLIRVGFSTGHGMTDKMASNPPEGVVFGFPTNNGWKPRFLRSPLKCFLQGFIPQYGNQKIYKLGIRGRNSIFCLVEIFFARGAYIVDVFERASKLPPDLGLRTCSDPDKDFNASDPGLREKYLTKIRTNPRARGAVLHVRNDSLGCTREVIRFRLGVSSYA